MRVLEIAENSPLPPCTTLFSNRDATYRGNRSIDINSDIHASATPLYPVQNLPCYRVVYIAMLNLVYHRPRTVSCVKVYHEKYRVSSATYIAVSLKLAVSETEDRMVFQHPPWSSGPKRSAFSDLFPSAPHSQDAPSKLGVKTRMVRGTRCLHLSILIKRLPIETRRWSIRIFALYHDVISKSTKYDDTLVGAFVIIISQGLRSINIFHGT